ncbi:OmpW/AlkL family protein [Xylophilus sp.]|uniref:OmpW/AlkL family protein n=1 Tax=Xylophilus sp. TaxID=2653893 RepID=UPI0013B5BA44|nr:OmpW family outer membrane protein [Xylophilus sp.]KAF1047403.1 MAG: Outer membrane protein W [Xylophilus sp.]
MSKAGFWTTTALFTATALLGGAAQAQQAGDLVLGAGWLHFAPQDSSEPLQVTTAAGTQTKEGSGAKVSNANTLGLNAVYYFDSNWGVEGVLGVPPKFKLDGTGTLAAVGRIGEAKQWSPTVLLRYTFLDGNDKFRPFVGVGGTYVWYSGVNLTSGINTALGLSSSAFTTTAKLSKSWAPVVNAGATYQFDRNWGLSFSVSYIPLDTKATLTTRANATGTTVATSRTKLTLDPIVSYLALTYKF